MEELYNLGISEGTIKSMVELNPNIKDMSTDELKEKVYLLKNINCADYQIINIISSNAMYLDKTSEGIIKLINKLKKLGFDTLNVLLDANPFILNLEPFELDDYINNRKNNGDIFEDIIDDLESNPYLFNEI